MTSPVRVATVRWRSPEPTAVDEELAVYDDGSAWLVVRSPRTTDPVVGTFSTVPSAEDHAALAGLGEVEVDLLAGSDESPGERVAEQVAALARAAPVATVAFHAAAPAPAEATLAVVGGGTRAVQFELDPGAVVVHVEAGGAEAGWREAAPLQTGFVTPGADGLGGVRRRAVVEPGQLGAIALDVPGLADLAGDAVVVQVSGWLYDYLPDDVEAARFRVRTAPAARSEQ